MQPTLTQGELLIRPLREDDFDALWAISSDPLLWEQHPSKERATLEGFKVWFNEAGNALVIEWQGKTVGTSRYKPWDPGIVEIGWTFLARDYWCLKRKYLDSLFTLFYHVGSISTCIDSRNFRGDIYCKPPCILSKL
jgi:hypothetical protein